jgi:hypothetical protein
MSARSSASPPGPSPVKLEMGRRQNPLHDNGEGRRAQRAGVRGRAPSASQLHLSFGSNQGRDESRPYCCSNQGRDESRPYCCSNQGRDESRPYCREALCTLLGGSAHDDGEGVGIKGCAADECAVDVGLGEEVGGVFGVDRAAVLEANGLRGVRAKMFGEFGA